MAKPRFRSIVMGFLTLVLVLGSYRALPAADSQPHGPAIVMIIRHAEKPDEPATGAKDPNLNARGYQRADALATVIPDHFPRPDFLIATKETKGSRRPIETITPLSKALHEAIDATIADDDYATLAHQVLTDPKYAGKVVLIAWHHGKIPELAEALGVKGVPAKWKDSVFDRLWEITYKDGVASWQDLPEHALPGDSDSPATKPSN
jgi:phosphohistidine phosphatase SixA